MLLSFLAAVVAVSEAGVGVPGVIWNASKFGVKNTTNVVYGQGLSCKGTVFTNCTATNLLLVSPRPKKPPPLARRRTHWANSQHCPALPLSDGVQDVYEPVDAGPTLRPAYILSHGGGNSGGSKEQYCFQGSAAFFTSRGFVAFNIDYRLAGEHGLLPPGPGPDPGPGPEPGPPPATAGDSIVAAPQTKAVMDWWPHPKPHSGGPGGPKTTPLRFGGPAGTLCITLKPAPGPPYCSCCPTTCCADPARPGTAACQCCRGPPPPVTHSLALAPCATAGSAAASQLWTVQSWGIHPQAVVHNATGLCLSIPGSTPGDSGPRPVEAAPCQRASPGQLWQLGTSGRLFTTVPATLGSVNSVELSAVPAATATASLNVAATNADDDGYDGYQQETAARGQAEDSDRPPLMGWTPKWQSGYPAVRDLKAAIRWVCGRSRHLCPMIASSSCPVSPRPNRGAPRMVSCRCHVLIDAPNPIPCPNASSSGTGQRRQVSQRCKSLPPPTRGYRHLL